MKKALLITASVILAIGVMVYVLIANSQRSSHMHFTTRGGVLKNVVYYSASRPERASQHQCDGKFADMVDDLYQTHLKLWQQKYGREEPDSVE